MSLLLCFFISCVSNEQNILKVMVPEEPISITPYDANCTPGNRVRVQIFEKLLTVNSQGSLIPQLAKSWVYITPKILELKIRNDVRFHDGALLTVQDIKYSLERAFASPNLQTILDVFEDVKIIDTNTVQIHMSQGNDQIPLLLATHGAIITRMPRADKDVSVEEIPDVNLNGTGPFRFVRWSKNDRIVLERNPYYHGAKVFVDGIELIVEYNVEKRAKAIQNGQAHIAYDVGMYSLKEDEKSLNRISVPTHRLEYLGITTTHESLADVRLRKAIALAIDKEKLIASVMNNNASVATSVLSDLAHYHHPSQDHQDIEKAKLLLKEAGIESGYKLEMWAVKGYRLNLANEIKEDLAKIGLDLTVVCQDDFTYYEGIRGGRAPMFLLARSTIVPDADLFMFSLLHSNSVGVGGNYSMYRNGDMDNYLNIGRNYSMKDLHRENYNLAQELVNTDVPIVPLFHPFNKLLTSTSVSNFKVQNTFIHDLKDVIINQTINKKRV